MNAVEVEVFAMHVNLLIPSGHHRNCPGTAFEKDAVGVVTDHHG
jgi:hypothetical protein